MNRDDDYINSLNKLITEKSAEIAGNLNELAMVHKNRKEFNLVIEKLEKAILFDPANPNFYINLGFAYINSTEYEKAIEAYSRVIELNPDDAVFYNNLGVCYYKNYQFDLAIDNYNKAISLRPDFVEAYSNLSHLYIMNGNFEEGWKYYEWRFKQKELQHLNIPKFQTPVWDSNNSIKNKTIYVYWEQGYGDTLMFCRYLPVLHAMGAKVLFKPQPALENLLRENDLKAEIISPSVSDETIQFDEYASLMSLPYLLKTTLENIPYPEGYLKADPEKVKIYKEKYFNNNLFKVGIFWQGNPKGMKERATDLKNFYKLSEIENVELYSLQKGYGIEQLKELPDSIKITDLGSVFNDYSDTAAAISNLDLVITIDTSVAHLAAAMNKPTWILLPYFPEWRWIRDREDTPWYKSIKLFKQKERNNWEEVMDRVCKELANKQLYNIK